MDYTRYGINITQKTIHMDENIVAVKTIKERFCIKGNAISVLINDVMEQFEQPSSVDYAISILSAKYNTELLNRVVSLLIEKTVLIKHDESITLIECDKTLLEKTIYYTLGDMTLDEVTRLMEKMKIGIIGTSQLIYSILDNMIGSELLNSFNIGVTNTNEGTSFCREDIEVTEFPLADNLEQLDTLIESSDFVIVASNYNDHYLFSKVNEICCGNNKRWLRVVVDGYKSEVGPIVIPNDTCCYECMRTRNKQNMSEDEYVFDNLDQMQSKKRQPAEYNSMYPLYSIVSGISSAEIIKYYAGMKCNLLNQVIMIDCVDFRTQIDYIYKVYSCAVCGREDTIKVWV